MTTAPCADLFQRLANEFSRLIRDALSPSDMSDVRRRIRTGKVQTCATLDFCDGYTVMASAFKLVMGREPAPFSNADSDVCRAAWGLAQYAEFPRRPELTATPSGEAVYAFRIRDNWIVDPRRSEDLSTEVDPYRYYGLYPEELTAFDDANLLLSVPSAAQAPPPTPSNQFSADEEDTAVLASLRANYPRVSFWCTEHGTRALRIDCACGVYILIVERGGAHSPLPDSTGVDVGVFNANDDFVDGANAVPVAELIEWINAAILRSAHNVADYFLARLGVSVKDPTLLEVPTDSDRGIECVKAIAATAELCAHVRATCGPKPTFHPLISLARHVICLYSHR